jgi:hypothetical protein
MLSTGGGGQEMKAKEKGAEILPEIDDLIKMEEEGNE